jgi:hypothetical protein
MRARIPRGAAARQRNTGGCGAVLVSGSACSVRLVSGVEAPAADERPPPPRHASAAAACVHRASWQRFSAWGRCAGLPVARADSRASLCSWPLMPRSASTACSISSALTNSGTDPSSRRSRPNIRSALTPQQRGGSPLRERQNGSQSLGLLITWTRRSPTRGRLPGRVKAAICRPPGLQLAAIGGRCGAAQPGPPGAWVSSSPWLPTVPGRRGRWPVRTPMRRSAAAVTTNVSAKRQLAEPGVERRHPTIALACPGAHRSGCPNLGSKGARSGWQTVPRCGSLRWTR